MLIIFQEIPRSFLKYLLVETKAASLFEHKITIDFPTIILNVKF